MISYAQRHEDEKLAALLTDVTRGFWIDIGAWDPVLDSVTKGFSDVGWSGINVEPTPYYHDRLVAARPRDINLQMAVSDHKGWGDLHYIPNTGLSTFQDDHAAKFAAQYPMEMIRVPLMTLKRMCQIYVPRGREIDFLKIDVEGHEREVLTGGDWRTYRPRILCIEATEPGTDIPAWSTWEPFVLDTMGYDFIEFDSLNRWYRRGGG